jgi:DnaK suppressor protein
VLKSLVWSNQQEPILLKEVNEREMHAADLKKYRDVLESKRDDLLNATPARTPASEPGSKSGDWIDQSSQESDLHVHLALKQTDAKLLRAIEEAILRLDQGTYGICMDCENEIPTVRLDAVLWTRVCIDCKERQSSRKS